jgi:hypothetical protein
MRAWVGVLFAIGALGQEVPPTGIVRGTLLEWDGSGSAGEMSVRARDYRVHWFRFDSSTYFEQEGKRTTLEEIRSGATLEILSDRGGAPRERYARTVKVIPDAVRRGFPQYRTRYRTARRSLVDELFPRGNLTFAGAVLRLGQEFLVLRIRTGTERRILLRDDTRYLQGGGPADLGELQVNTRVFVRGGENLEGEVEAYQVIWGDILRPRSN